MKNKMAMIWVLFGMLLFSSLPAQAYAEKGANCNVYGKNDGDCVSGKLTWKAHFLVNHQSELNLTDDQVKTIQELKLQMKKDNAQQKADIEIILLDLKSILRQDTVDVESAKALVDKKLAIESEAMKSGIEAYAKLKSVLTPDQLNKAKALFKEKRKTWGGKNKGNSE